MNLHCQLKKFKERIESYEITSVQKRFYLLKTVILIWISCTVGVATIYNKYVFDFEVLDKAFNQDLTVKLFNFLPTLIKNYFFNNPSSIQIIILVLALTLLINKKNSFILWVQFWAFFNLYYCSAYAITSGATTIVTNLLSYILLIEFFLKIEQWKNELSIVKHWIFFLMRCQLTVVYFVSGMVKLKSSLWRNGAATYYIFQNKRYFKIPFIETLLFQNDILLRLSSLLPMIFLMLFCVFIWTKKNKGIIIFSFLFHGFIAIGMGLKEFMIFPIIDVILFGKIDSYIKFFSINKAEANRVLKLST